ncbi:MAG: hypothetical protein ACKO8O_19875 [Betaproteobacteria bacterium]
MASAAASTSLVELAVKHFQVLEALDLPAQYERSFKLQPGELITQRYMLGVDARQAPRQALQEAAHRIGLPAAMRPLFEQALDDASTVLFGFEGVEGSEHSSGRAVFKVYAEHRSRLAGRSVEDGPIELFRGFKWHADRQDSGVQTIYWCHPGLSTQSLRAKMSALLADSALAHAARCCEAILDRVVALRSGVQPQWLELGERDQPIRAFDLNLYSAGLQVDAIGQPIRQLAEAFGIERQSLDRLLALAGGGLLGHLSAGASRNGQGFVTVYFEPVSAASEAS